MRSRPRARTPSRHPHCGGLLMGIVDNLFRVLKKFEYKPRFSRPAEIAEPGKVISIPGKKEVARLMGLGYIEELRIAFSNPNTRFRPLPARQFRGKRVGIWLQTSHYYSGGRVHLYQYAWSLANSGAEVFMISNGGPPKWSGDYPPQKCLHFVIDGRQNPPEDLDILMTDSKGSTGMGVMHYRRTHPRTVLCVLNFETPNWVSIFVEEYAQKLNLTQRNRVAFQDADLIIANSGESLKYLKEWIGNEHKYEHEGVLMPAMNEFALERSKKIDWPKSLDRPTRPYAAFSARPAAYKNFDLAVESIWSLKVPFDIAIFGKPPRQVQGNDMHHAYIYSGQPDSVKYVMFRDATLVLAPSLFEGCGLVPAEALASGTPCVCMRLPVLEEVYGDRLIYCDWDDKMMYKRTVAEVVRRAGHVE